MITIVAFVFGVALGFAAGRVKNGAKLDAVSAEIAKIEATATGAVSSAILKIKSKL